MDSRLPPSCSSGPGFQLCHPEPGWLLSSGGSRFTATALPGIEGREDDTSLPSVSPLPGTVVWGLSVRGDWLCPPPSKCLLAMGLLMVPERGIPPRRLPNGVLFIFLLKKKLWLLLFLFGFAALGLCQPVILILCYFSESHCPRVALRRLLSPRPKPVKEF